MILIEYAAYAAIIGIILLFAARAMWIAFFFFCYRFWMILLPYKAINNHIHLIHGWDYAVIIILLTAGTYFGFYYLTLRMQILRYIIFILMILFVLHFYTFSDIFLFKDYLKAHHMWNTAYWAHQIHQIFIISTSKKENIFMMAWNNVINFIKSLFHYAKI